MLALTSCNDYLEVDPASNAATPELVYGSEGETRTALYGIYAKICSDNLFGNRLYNDFQLNSDVDFVSNSNEAAAGNQPRRFDVRSDAGNVETLWNNLYAGIETANEFIYNLKNSEIYAEEVEDAAVEEEDGTTSTTQVPVATNVTQMMGEAKVMRAMMYHELLSYFGDIPFTLQGTYESDNFLPEVTPRQQVSDALIEDLKYAAEYMQSDVTLGTVERISKEAAYAMIARLALQAGGYSLNHDPNDATNYKMTRPSDYQKYYQIARDYAKKVIDSGTHSLTKSYSQVFVDECNFIVTTGDDPIFELPLSKNNTGYFGYAQGPKSDIDTSDETDYSNSNWGSTNGGVRVSALYRYSFDEKDLRRDYICGLWNYSNHGLPSMNITYGMNNNKWSKLWNSNGFAKTSSSDTGINFAYLRYTDVLLMFAEAENEINNGPTADAQEALKIVRRRAFASADRADLVDAYVAAATSKQDFLKLVLDERKWEFAGENMRWKDLVRNNQYAEKVFMTFMSYYAIAQDQGGASSYLDMVEEYAELPYSQLFAPDVFWCYVDNYNQTFNGKNINSVVFPNNSLPMIYVYNAYRASSKPTTKPATYFDDDDNLYLLKVKSEKDITGSGGTGTDWNTTTVTWVNDDGTPKNEILYSLYGFVRVNQRGNIVVVNNNAVTNFNVTTGSAAENISRLPDVRYILPYPEEAISRSNGVYKNYYGY